MAKVKISMLIFFSMLFVALSLPNYNLPPLPMAPSRPLCASQFALVNYACAVLPLVPLPTPATPPPALPSPLPPGSGHRSGHRQGHRHRHGHSHSHSHSHRHRQENHETPQQSYCCQWLKQLDLECVCDILVHLPAFLSRPNHQYTVVIDESCSVTYSCEGRLRT